MPGRSVALGLDGHNNMLKVAAMPMLLLYVLCLSVFFTPWGSSAEEAEAVAESALSAEAAGQKIDEFHAELLEIMKEAESLGFDGRAQRLQALLPDYIDQNYMGRKALGRKWKKLTPEQQKNFLEAFGVLNVYSYADRFNGYSGEQFEILSSVLDEKGDAKVKSQVVLVDADPVRLLYRLHVVDGHWSVKDVYLNGSVSEMALRRSEYTSILKAKGFDALLAAIWAKSDSMMKDDMAGPKVTSEE